MLAPINESKEKILKNEKLWSKIQNLIRSRTKHFDDYEKKYMKIKLDSDDESLLNIAIKLPIIKIVVRTVFHEDDKY